MKKILAAAFSFLAFSAFAGTDYWFFDTETGRITDGDWIFNASADKNRKMTVGQVSLDEYPTTITPLDFSKPVKDAADNEYTIKSLNCGFVVGTNPYGAQAPAQYVGELTLPGEGLTSIGNYSLGYLVNATGTLVWPTTLTSVGRFAFYNDSGVTINAEELSGITVLNLGSCFANCNLVGDLDLTHYSGTIPTAAFARTKLTSVKFGPGLTTLAGGYVDGAFYGCTQLGSVVFDPASSVYLGPGAVFGGCTALEEIDLRSVGTIWCPNSAGNTNNTGYAIFYGCTSLKKVHLSDKLTKWHYLAFAGCSSLEEVHYYGAPCAAIGYPVFSRREASNATADARKVDTFVHIGEDDAVAKAAWDAYTESGDINATNSTWRGDMVGIASSCALRPLLLYRTSRISIARGDDGDMENGVMGTFTISRAESDGTAGSVNVAYTLSGSAENGVDYETLSGTIVIPDGERSVVLYVIPRYNGAICTKDVSVTLASGDYEIDPDANTAAINVSCCLRSVSITKILDADEGKGTYGWFEVSRGEDDATAAPLSVSLAFAGNAVPGATYRSIPSPVVIPAGEKSVKIRVDPLDDPATTEDSTIIATITGDAYAVETATATMTVFNGAAYGGLKVYKNYMTDGKWSFNIQVNNQEDRRFPDGTRWLWILSIAAWPDVPSELNFDKTIVDCYHNVPFAIREFQSATTGASSRGFVSSLVLPDDPEHPYVLSGSCFESCTNLVSVTPFLPKCCITCTRAFRYCSNITNALEFSGQVFADQWSSFEGLSKIPSVDLSKSTVAQIGRECFKNCSSLQWIKLPPAIVHLGNSGGSSMEDRDPFGGCSNLKLIFTGEVMPTVTLIFGANTSVTEMEFEAGLNTLPDNAFSRFSGLEKITFRGAKPNSIGENVFSSLTAQKVTAYVPKSKAETWWPVASGGTVNSRLAEWISGTSQYIRTWSDCNSPFVVIIK